MRSKAGEVCIIRDLDEDQAGEVCLHCNENPINVFSEKELCGFNPNSHIHVSVIDLNIPRIGPHIFLQQNRQTDHRNI
jgi:hypothetical protein